MASFDYDRVIQSVFDDTLVLNFDFDNIDDSRINFKVYHPSPGEDGETAVAFEGSIRGVFTIEGYGDRELNITIRGGSFFNEITVLLIEDAEDPKLGNDPTFVNEVIRHLNRHNSTMTAADLESTMQFTLV